jgi:hypothetical protein
MGHIRHNPQDHHDHGHGDHRGNDSHLARLRHALSGLFGGHSHDSAQQIDKALEADRTGWRALWLSMAGLTVTAAFKGLWWWHQGRWLCLVTPCTTSPTP